MRVSTSRGGLASHAAVVARGWGIPAVVGAEALDVGDGEVRIGDRTLRAGDVITIADRDGTRRYVSPSIERVLGYPPAELAGLSILANFLWIPYYPIWSLTVIAFDVFVIWALVVHGRDVART